jgi:hypothetical protein
MNARRLLTVTAALALTSAALFAQSVSAPLNKKVPKPLQARFVTGDPEWRELPVRADFQSQYDRVWQTSVDTILEHNFDIATMDKGISGRSRTKGSSRWTRTGTTKSRSA